MELAASSAANAADELAAAITPVHADRAIRAALAVVLGGLRLGTPLRTRDLFDAFREVLGHGSALGGPPLTVAICTRDRDRQLERAIAAVSPALGEGDELLVVHNAPVETIPPPDGPCGQRVRFVVEARPGLDWARNRAIRESRTDVILFTDDDCVPHATWVGAMKSAFAANPDVDAVTGLIEPLALDTPAQVLFEQYGGFNRDCLRRWTYAPRQRRIAGVVGNMGEYGAGANFAIRRRLIDRVGPFDAALGAGTVTRGGDELEFLFRALKVRGLIAYEPRAMVRHEHRRDLLELEQQLEGWSSGFSCAIERAMLTFPEERMAFRMMRSRIAYLHHMRRALMHPRFRRLAFAELRGLRGASRRYAQSRRDAEGLAAAIASPASDCSPAEWGGEGAVTNRLPWRVTHVEVDAESLLDPIVVGNDIAAVSCAVRIGGQVKGTLDLAVLNESIGVDRLRDAIIDRMGGALLAGAWGAAVRDAHRYLADAARALSLATR